MDKERLHDWLKACSEGSKIERRYRQPPLVWGAGMCLPGQAGAPTRGPRPARLRVVG